MAEIKQEAVFLRKQINRLFEVSGNDTHRNSNFELFRIITMLFIIAHHYVVNSGLMANEGPIYQNLLSWRSQFLIMFGAFGKTGINCFVLITGYFMCQSKITARKFGKLVLEMCFYSLVITSIFWITGYERYSIFSFLMIIFPLNYIGFIDQNFASCYLLFYLCIPFLNVLIHHMNEKQHFRLLLLTGFMYVFIGTIPFYHVLMNHVSWYIVLYLLASYTRLYPKRLFNRTSLWRYLTILFFILSVLSIYVISWLGYKLNREFPPIYTLVSDSNKCLAFATAFSAFLYFKNLKIKQSLFINKMAASTFGILIIHGNSDTMRRWLWGDVLKNTSMYYSAWMPVHAICSTLIIFFVCFILDQIRICYFEDRYLKIWDKCCINVASVYTRFEEMWLKIK